MFQRRPAEPERAMLDSGYLDRLESHLGSAALAELLADGLIELTDRLKRVGELERSANLEALAGLGHDLVGMAGNLGLARLSAAAADMNRAARDGSVPAAQAEAAAVRRLGVEATDALRQHLDRLARD